MRRPVAPPLPSSMASLPWLVFVLLLGACSAPALKETPDWNQQRADLAAISDWNVSGKIAVRSSEGLDSANLRWEQRGNALRLELSGPVGMGQVVLEHSDNGTRALRDGSWHHYENGIVDVERELGWPLPLELMPWWLRGLPAPEPAADQVITEGGRLAQIEQAQWSLEFVEFREADARQLPTRINFSGNGVSGKLLLKRWNVSP